MKFFIPLVLLVYFLLGLALVMRWKPVDHLPVVARFTLAGLCLAYIIYRGYRYYITYFSKNNE